jgi:mercuric ion transport protein
MTVRDEVGALPGRVEGPARRGAGGKVLLPFGGILAALAAASCCVVPFVLFVGGVSGAWIGNLTALKPYQPIFVGVALACLGGGFYAVYLKATLVDCVEGSYCARPASDRIAKIGLWFATALVLVALGFPYAVRFFLDT